MSKYTTQLRYICEEKAGLLESTGDYNKVISESWYKIIKPETVLFDPNYAAVLFPKIIKHYYFDEIAHETVAHFIFRLNTKLDEILPYYNQLYKSALIEFDPLGDTDYTITGNREDNNTFDSTRTDNLVNNITNKSKNLKSDTPQGTIANLDINNNLYLSEAEINDSLVNNENRGTQKHADIIHNLNDYYEHVTGKRGGMSNAEALLKFRETFINIDMLVIDELRPLFMGVY